MCQNVWNTFVVWFVIVPDFLPFVESTTQKHHLTTPSIPLRRQVTSIIHKPNMCIFLSDLPSDCMRARGQNGSLGGNACGKETAPCQDGLAWAATQDIERPETNQKECVWYSIVSSMKSHTKVCTSRTEFAWIIMAVKPPTRKGLLEFLRGSDVDCLWWYSIVGPMCLQYGPIM